MANRTADIDDRDQWIINFVATNIRPSTFVEQRQLERIFDAFEVEQRIGLLEHMIPKEDPASRRTVECEEAAFNFLLKNFEPSLQKFPGAFPAWRVSRSLRALHDRMSEPKA